MSRAREAQNRAAEWILARENPSWSDADQTALEAWLSESDMHRVAFIRLEYSWRQADRIASLGHGQKSETLRERRSAPRRRETQRWWIPLAAAASLVAVLGTGWRNLYPTDKSTSSEAAAMHYSSFDTKVGGHKTIGLPDGSKVELNTASAVRTALNNEGREVWLDQGEAYFEVAQDKKRPFVVHVGKRQITVLGTKFSVRRDGDEISVFVREGRVRLDEIDNAHIVRTTTISGGDMALARNGAPLMAATDNVWVEDALSWREGMLTFDQAPLSDVAAEFNRYNRQQLIITDPAVGRIMIGGKYPAAKPVEFGRLLRDAYGLKLKETPDAVRISN